MAALRVERARLLGYETHAAFVLEDAMAKEPGKVYELLRKLWTPALERAKAEAAELQKMIDEEGGRFQLQSWDWWYYAEKVKKARYDLDEEMLRPYFKLENVLDGAFGLATRLYGLKFEKRPEIPGYHKDVAVFEVKEADGQHVGVLYVDYFPRPSKRGGAWMGEFREQRRIGEKDVRPVIYNVGNFSKPAADKPSLLSFDEVETLFHEFGHALHGLLSECTYKSLSGTNVVRDFVELPSQIMENWASAPEMLKVYARHYQTGEPIPMGDRKDQEVAAFQPGVRNHRSTWRPPFLDMDGHTPRRRRPDVDVLDFERQSMQRIGLVDQIAPRYRSPYFQHIFAGGVFVGLLSYAGPGAPTPMPSRRSARKATCSMHTRRRAFRRNILAKGNTEEPMELYKRFRGRERIEPLVLKRAGWVGGRWFAARVPSSMLSLFQAVGDRLQTCTRQTATQHSSVNRRDFLKITGAGAALLSSGVWSELSAAESASPSEKLNIACVGTANRAQADIDGVKGENIVALCDVDKNYLDRAAALSERADLCRLPGNDREEAGKVDAVVVGTADHHHAPASIRAIRAGMRVLRKTADPHGVRVAAVGRGSQETRPGDPGGPRRFTLATITAALSKSSSPARSARSVKSTSGSARRGAAASGRRAVKNRPQRSTGTSGWARAAGRPFWPGVYHPANGAAGGISAPARSATWPATTWTCPSGPQSALPVTCRSRSPEVHPETCRSA